MMILKHVLEKFREQWNEETGKRNEQNCPSVSGLEGD
jgi:hypothetical protein